MKGKADQVFRYSSFHHTHTMNTCFRSHVWNFMVNSTNKADKNRNVLISTFNCVNLFSPTWCSFSHMNNVGRSVGSKLFNRHMNPSAIICQRTPWTLTCCCVLTCYATDNNPHLLLCLDVLFYRLISVLSLSIVLCKIASFLRYTMLNALYTAGRLYLSVQ